MGAYAPILFAEAVLVGSYLGVWLLPEAEEIHQPGALTLFVGCAYLGLFLGYCCGIHCKRRVPLAATVLQPPMRLGRNLIVCSAIYTAAYAVLLLSTTGYSLSQLIDQVLQPGLAYAAKFEREQRQDLASDAGGSTRLTMLFTGTFVLSYFLMPLSIALWKRLPWAIRGMAIAAAGLFATYYLAIGTRKGLGDLTVYGLSGALALRYGKWSSPSRSRAQRVAWILFVAVLVGGFLFYFGYSATSRLKVDSTTDFSFVERSPLLEVIWPDAALGVLEGVKYTSHGYCGLSKSLDCDFVWTGGVGHSYGIHLLAKRFFGIEDIFPQTYVARSERLTGWPALNSWSTAFPWFASDLTFPGCLPLMILVGWFWAKTWVEGAYECDPIALVMFSHLSLGILYLPANNQLFQEPAGVLGTIGLCLLYACRAWFLPQRRAGQLSPGQCV
jgi:hypothetical protein